MKLKEFVNFNTHCPLCKNPLKLYLQLFDSMCFEAEKIDDSKYKFTQAYCKDELFSSDEFIIIDINRPESLIVSSSKLENKILKSQIYFFYLCNDAGINIISDSYNNKSDYEINLYYGCYYRSTPVFEFRKNKNKYYIYNVNEQADSLINYDENFSISRFVNNVEKIYVVNINYEQNKTVLWHYSCDEEQAKDKSYIPDMFEKTFPKAQLKFDSKNKEKLMDRFDNWILMS